MTKPFLIGDLARRTGKSVHAIRWYETRGLIPGVTRDSGGRRVYHPDHIGWFDFISRLRATGMTIARIGEYARLVKRGRETLPDRIALLEDQRARIEEQQQALEDAQGLIDAKVKYYRQWEKTGKRPPEIPSIESVRAARRRPK